MERDAGAIVERVVRRSGLGIAELARILHVDRRSIYYWFKQPNLKVEILYKIGDAVGYDFSKDFPHLVKKTEGQELGFADNGSIAPEESGTLDYWKNKYIKLLEKYNDLLLKISLESEN